MKDFEVKFKYQYVYDKADRRPVRFPLASPRNKEDPKGMSSFLSFSIKTRERFP